MHQLSKKCVICLAVIISPFEAIAQDTGGAINVGQTNLVPSLRIEFESTDNTFRTENDGIDGSRVIIRPELRWSAERRLLQLNAVYRGAFTANTDVAPSFSNHSLTFSGNAAINSKNRSRASLSIASDSNDIGTGVLSNATESDPNEVAEITNIEFSASHTYGATAARGNLSAGLELQSRDFRNQATFTEGRNLIRVSPFLQFSYRVSSDTRLIAGGEIANLAFDDDSRDRLDSTIFTGFDFSPSSKLSGQFRIGATQSSFDDSTRSDQSSLFLESDLNYEPRNFATLYLSLRRELDNSRGDITSTDNAISTNIEAGWDHVWSSRITSSAAIDIDIFEADCPEPSDTVTTPSFEIEYALRRWISFGLSASQEQRNVSNCTNLAANNAALEDYERVSFGAFIRGTL